MHHSAGGWLLQETRKLVTNNFTKCGAFDMLTSPRTTVRRYAAKHVIKLSVGRKQMKLNKADFTSNSRHHCLCTVTPVSCTFTTIHRRIHHSVLSSSHSHPCPHLSVLSRACLSVCLSGCRNFPK